jgi:hypothetical protein
LKVIGLVSRVGGGQLNPDHVEGWGRPVDAASSRVATRQDAASTAGDLAVTAGWGHAGKGGVTMPGSGKAEERPYTPEELAAIEAGAGELGLSREEALRHLGESTLDLYLNGVAYWRNVPARVWDYRIGGYQVMKKWRRGGPCGRPLGGGDKPRPYRERDLLGRSLTADEARYVTEMARRLAALVLLEPALDANYAAVKANTYPWPQA